MQQQQGGCRTRGYDNRLLLLHGSMSLLRRGRLGAPSLTIAGAYFPAWLACAVLAIVAAVAVRSVMIASGLSRFLPLQLAVCVALGTLVGLAVWYWWVMA